MTEGIRSMKALGYVEVKDKPEIIVRQFTKYDDNKGYPTDIINYFISGEKGIEVYVNNLEYHCGSRIDKDLLNAILMNFYELEAYYKAKEQE